MAERKMNPDHVEAVLAFINESPYFKLLSMTVREIGTGYSLVEVAVGDKHLSPFGLVHGGLYCSALDTAAFWSAYGEIDEEAGLITLDVNTNILAPVKGKRLWVKGRRIKIGQTFCTTEAEAQNESGDILAHATSKILVAREPGMIQKIRKTFGDGDFPPKYISD